MKRRQIIVTRCPMPEGPFASLLAETGAKRAWVASIVGEAVRVTASFRAIGIAAKRAAKAIKPLACLIIEAERGASIGRKRRMRRARGRARGRK